MPLTPLQHYFNTALAHLQANRISEAQSLFRQILAQNPNHVPSLHLLAVTFLRTGTPQAAVELLQRAITLNPQDPGLHSDLGEAHRALSQLDLAIACYHRALALKPSFPEVLDNLGLALTSKGDFDQAIAAHQKALALDPNFPNAHNNLGTAFSQNKLYDQAILAFQRAIALAPNFAFAHNNLGSVFLNQKAFDKALSCFHRALEINPGYSEAHCNLGVALHDQGRFAESLPCFQRAIELRPDYADAHYDLGNSYRDLGRPDDAIECHRRALDLQPNSARAINNLAGILNDTGRVDEAITHYRQAYAANSLDPALHSNIILAMHYSPTTTGPEILAEARRWNFRHAVPLRPLIQPHHNVRNPDRRLRIGYVSPDFREHAAGAALLPLLGNHDHNRHEIFCYSNFPSSDAVTARFRGYADHWREIFDHSDQQVAEQIRADNIDILIDLTLHTFHNRLLVVAQKPAPLQISHIGYAGTTGLDAIDYHITDPFLDPPEIDSAASYSEKLAYLPRTALCYEPLGETPDVNPLPALTAGHITFGSLNNYCKINDPLLQLWATVLHAVPSSRLILVVPEGSHRRHAHDLLSAAGIDPARLSWLLRAKRYEYLTGYHRIDITLDPLPFNGHITSLDSHWMGVPVVTLEGATAVGRGGVSQLTNLNLPHLIARTPEQFAQIASTLAADLPKLAELRQTLRKKIQSSPLMDGPAYARDFETLLRNLWVNFCNEKSTRLTQLPPEPPTPPTR